MPYYMFALRLVYVWYDPNLPILLGERVLKKGCKAKEVYCNILKNISKKCSYSMTHR